MPTYREGKIRPLVGAVDGVNRTFIISGATFFAGTERVFWDGVKYEEGDAVRGWARVDSQTVLLATAPKVGTELELFYLEEDPSDTLSPLVDVRSGPFAPNEITGKEGCIAAGAWACETGVPEFPVYDVNCLSADEVGNCVYVTGPVLAGKFQVATVDISDSSKVPAVGILLAKTSPTGRASAPLSQRLGAGCASTTARCRAVR
jgi:hypothetical protein